MQEKNLKLLRFEIDTIDDQLLKLLIQRSLIVEKIGNIKQSSDNVVDKSRESKIISRLLDLHKGNFAKDSIVRIWREIFHTSANIQLKKNNVLKPKRGIDSIKLYKGGTSKISGINKIIKLSSNESPFGPSTKVIEAYKKIPGALKWGAETLLPGWAERGADLMTHHLSYVMIFIQRLLPLLSPMQSLDLLDSLRSSNEIYNAEVLSKALSRC